MRLARAYRETRFEAAGQTARIGYDAPGVRALLGGRAGGFVGAWNPYSRKMPAGWNERMARALEAWVWKYPRWPGEGRWRGWSERHLLIAADPRRLVTLARRFRQAAIVVVPLRGRPRLKWLTYRRACSR